MLLELSLLPVEIQQQLVKNHHIELKLVDNQVIATPIAQRKANLLAHLQLNANEHAFKPLDHQEIKEYFDHAFT